MNSDEAKNDRDLEIPPKLRADLASLEAGRSVPVPPKVDEAVLAAARRRLVGVPRRRRTLRLAAIAAAAALLVVVFFWGRHEAAYMDIDGSGRIDILDAYTLALRLEAGDVSRGEWDFNDDGEVDSGDVDLVAQQAVRIR